MDTVTIPKTLQKKLRRISEETGQLPEQLVAAALEEKLRYEEWLLRSIDAGLSDLKAGRVLPTKELVEQLKLKGATRVRAGRKAA
jgi:predicted transcriptional regulator